MPKQKIKVTPLRPGGVPTYAGCHKPPPPHPPRETRIEGVTFFNLSLLA